MDDVTYKAGDVTRKHIFTVKPALISMAGENLVARFRTNPQKPECKDSMRLVKVLCTEKRPVTLTHSHKSQNIHWTFEIVVENGHDHVV